MSKGFKQTVLSSVPAKKKPRCARKISPDENKDEDEQRQEGNATPVTPHTPIWVLQQVGRTLQIPEEDLAEGRLDAAPKDGTSQNGDNE